uniref:PID domain-containing protein n=1 Tax=Varanus komodoensis TaxID=61221 RepID=A0A8D2L7Y8_VARKO
REPNIECSHLNPLNKSSPCTFCVFQDTTDYVAYVAKDPVNQRACHILECPSGIAQEVINTIGQAFELRFKQYLKNPSALIASNERSVSTWNAQDKEDHEYYNEIPGKEPPTGGLLDNRLKVFPEQRTTRPMHHEQQHCPVSVLRWLSNVPRLFRTNFHSSWNN